MKDKVILIKKYPNRRLYNTDNSSYITLEDLSTLIKSHYNIKVIDAKTGDDITKITLTQIILEQQQHGYDILPIELLQQIIKLQHQDMGKIFFDYIKLSISYFTENYSSTNQILSNLNNPADKVDTLIKNMQLFNNQNINFMQMALSALNIFNTNNKGK